MHDFTGNEQVHKSETGQVVISLGKLVRLNDYVPTDGRLGLAETAVILFAIPSII